MTETPKEPDMTKIDALIANPGHRPDREPLPSPADRKRLRTAYKVTQQQVADAIGVTPGNVAGWESGRWEPSGKNRTEYAYLLRSIAQRLGETTNWEGDPQ